MAAPATPEKVKATPDAAESPTTARPLDFDDDQQETGVTTIDTAETSNPTPPSKPPRTSSMQHNARSEEEEQPPPKPPRPSSPQQHAENTLIEAFPSIDSKVVKAVLVASGGQVEPAFNALLSMSDPDFQQEEAPPARPPRPPPQRSQLEQDELYAQQLQAHYSQPRGPPRDTRGMEEQRRPSRPVEGEDERDYSFFDDDLPAIRENMRQGFLTTQTKVNKWITDFRKRIDGDEDEIGPGPASAQQPQRQNFGSSQREQMAGIRKMTDRQSAARRRSTDQDRYDADPKVLSDNFSELELHDEETPPPKPARPLANPDLFKPTPATPMAPQSGPVDEVDALYRQPTGTPNRQPSPSTGGKSKKWQPLTSVAPAPEADENDPFSLGDSDDEKEKEAKGIDIRAEDTARLKKAASMSAEEGGNSGEKGGDASVERTGSLEEAEQTGSAGTRDKIAEELLTGKK